MYKHGAKPVVGLIGAIGGGKSTAARCFAARGGFVIDADALGHEALRRPEVVAALVARWGGGVRKPDGSLDRRAIGKIVFADPAERSALEALVFPHIGKRAVEEIARGIADPTARFVVLDAAVLLVRAGIRTWTGSSTWMPPATCAWPGSRPAAGGRMTNWPPARPRNGRWKTRSPGRTSS
jgi:dephospho-CoA kinase